MESLLSVGLDGEATHYDKAFKKVAGLLKDLGCFYVFSGALACGQYARPRFTNRIDVICSPGDQVRIETALAVSGFRLIRSSAGVSTMNAQTGKVQVVLWGNGSRANDYALAHSIWREVFSVSARFASPPALLWILLEGGEQQDRADAIALIESTRTSLVEAQSLLSQHNASEALNALSRLYVDIRREKNAGSYCDSVHARILRQQIRNKGKA